MSVLTLIGKDLKVILVNNSENFDLNKVKFDKNVTIINSKNNGNGAAINLALEKISTKYAIISSEYSVNPKKLTPDKTSNDLKSKANK